MGLNNGTERIENLLLSLREDPRRDKRVMVNLARLFNYRDISNSGIRKLEVVIRPDLAASIMASNMTMDDIYTLEEVIQQNREKLSDFNINIKLKNDLLRKMKESLKPKDKLVFDFAKNETENLVAALHDEPLNLKNVMAHFASLCRYDAQKKRYCLKEEMTQQFLDLSLEDVDELHKIIHGHEAELSALNINPTLKNEILEEMHQLAYEPSRQVTPSTATKQSDPSVPEKQIDKTTQIEVNAVKSKAQQLSDRIKYTKLLAQQWRHDLSKRKHHPHSSKIVDANQSDKPERKSQ